MIEELAACQLVKQRHLVMIIEPKYCWHHFHEVERERYCNGFRIKKMCHYCQAVIYHFVTKRNVYSNLISIRSREADAFGHKAP